jgi:hypothetical protein
MIAGNYRIFYIYSTACLVGLIIGFIRRRVDTRIYMEIWREKVTHAVMRLLSRNVDSSKIICRSQNIMRITSFFEYTLPQSISAFFYIIVSSFMIWSALDWQGLIIIGMALLAIVISYIFSQIVGLVEVQCQEIREKREAAILARTISEIDQCYKHLKSLYVKRSDVEAYGWGLFDILAVGASLIAVAILVQVSPTTGTILYTMTYVDKLFNSTSMMPTFFNSLKEIQIMVDFLEKD